MRGNSLEARDRASVIHGLTDLVAHAERGPLVIERGRGATVTDVAGRDYIEGMSGLWCASLGFHQPRLAEAAKRQMNELPYYHLTNHRSHPRVIELAEALLAIAPAPMARVWFASTGSEANDCAARLAWYYWGAVGRPEKRRFLAHRGAYHGNTIAAASLTGADYAHRGFGLPLEGFHHVRSPELFREGLPGESEEAFADRLVGEIEETILRLGPDTIAAFFAEPILAAGGVVVPPATYYEKLRRLLSRHDVLLVCDEVVTAFGRTGEMFGATTMGIVPDMLICAKALSGAFIPVSALLVSPRLYEAIERRSGELGVFGLTMTYSGHPVAAAVALEALALYAEMDVAARARRLEEPFLGGLSRRLGRHPLVGEVRGRGLLAGVALAASREPRRLHPPERGVGKAVAAAAERRGLLVRAIGDVIALCPPLVIEEAEIEALIDRLAGAMDEVAAAL